MTHKFDKIKPFSNAELSTVLQRLANKKDFIMTLVKFKFAKWPRASYPLLSLITKMFIKRKFADINSLSEFQILVEPYMRRMIKKTCAELTVSGLDTLGLSKPCLFVSNHRDIALDPAFVNWVLHINGQDTVRIAVGDNLLHKDWVADLIRLNKCFVVERSVEGRREKLAAAKLLSEYIEHTLKNDRQHIWIAQREGRAKDGIDLTNPAIVSMLSLNKPKDMSFGDYIRDLRIVPVSLSYEFDPCDIHKAKELYQAEQEGKYDKPDNEDMQSIVSGITGQKGKVHVHFGKLVGGDFENAKQVASYIDKEVLHGLRIYPTSIEAARLLGRQDMRASSQNAEMAHAYLLERLARLSDAEQRKLLLMYANPLIRKQEQNTETA
ncbi:1-acyl-sn-glycerol-3-phosphate acyltransferase [Alteromonas sp. W364]|uniref:1-acyl-sn-glycerol-3-phosphate acyltransferase n=1 Tax=Alteromonas sp. W364 TaxID=3075610 RepID=UPI002886E6FB|nr:1-acyl-sn-glycerol-3-phosphate acyltransferase [Alteromonas sp. W364]MDT0629146.1 1-acyl-sn-glycerol-3-phosphate acyltransferase [Alteromonas sp. W364]